MNFRRIRTVGALLALTAPLFFATQGPASAGDGFYWAVRNYFNGLCLAVAGGSTSNNAKIVQHTCDLVDSKEFRWDGISTSTYIRVGNGKCLSPAGGSTASLAQIVQYNCDRDLARQWYVLSYSSSSGYVQFQNRKSGLCITPNGQSTSNNSVMVQYLCDAHASRLWSDYLSK